MSGIFETLEKIKARPGMYLGKPSVNHLFMFIEGYSLARQECGFEPTVSESEFYGEFQPWLQNRLKITTSNSWAALIQFQCGDEREALSYFFQLLDEFQNRHQPIDRSVTEHRVEQAAIYVN